MLYNWWVSKQVILCKVTLLESNQLAKPGLILASDIFDTLALKEIVL